MHEPISGEINCIQRNLEWELAELRCYTKHVNDYMNVITPWTLKVTHLRRRNQWYPVYTRMRDGIHRLCTKHTD